MWVCAHEELGERLLRSVGIVIHNAIAAIYDAACVYLCGVCKKRRSALALMSRAKKLSLLFCVRMSIESLAKRNGVYYCCMSDLACGIHNSPFARCSCAASTLCMAWHAAYDMAWRGTAGKCSESDSQQPPTLGHACRCPEERRAIVNSRPRLGTHADAQRREER